MAQDTKGSSTGGKQQGSGSDKSGQQLQKGGSGGQSGSDKSSGKTSDKKDGSKR